MSKFKVAAVQAEPVFMNRDGSVEKTCKLVDEAASNGAKIIAFPETFIPGYPFWIWTKNVGDGIGWFQQLYNNAVEIPSPAIVKLAEAAKRNAVYFCVSVTEKDRGSLYLTQLWFGPEGNLLGKHRKMKASGAERTIWGDGDGSMMPVFDTEYGRLGGLSCWENAIPVNGMALSAQNEQIHIAAWPNFQPDDNNIFSYRSCDIIQKAYSIQFSVFSLMSSQVAVNPEALRGVPGFTDFDIDFMAHAPSNTQILSPSGRVLASVDQGVEGICYADIDLSEIPLHKYLTDPTGHYSTPGSLSLIFDRREHTAVKIIGDEQDMSISYDELQK